MNTIKFTKIHPSAQCPTKNEGDQGWDLYAVADTQWEVVNRQKPSKVEPKLIDYKSIETTLSPGERKIIKTGICLSFPPGHYGVFKDRSGYAAKHGLTVLAGLIDEGYTGELMIVLLNTGKKPIIIQKGDRIAQMIIHKENPVVWQELDADDFNNIQTQRGAGGFGSTGK